MKEDLQVGRFYSQISTTDETFPTIKRTVILQTVDMHESLASYFFRTTVWPGVFQEMVEAMNF